MGDICITDAFEIYRRDYIVYRNQASKTEEMHLLAMKSLVSFLGDPPVSTLTFQNVRDWKDYLSKSKSQNTVRGYILKLRVVLDFIRKMGYKALDPEIIGVPKRTTKVVDFLTEEEINIILDVVFKPAPGYGTVNRYRSRAVIAFLYASGIRVSELCKLNRTDIRSDNTFTVVGKRDKPRLCFLDERAKAYLNEYLDLRKDNNPALFLSERTGERISAGTVQEIFRVARAKSGLKGAIHPHIMRHSFATNLLRNNTNLLYVKEFLGHTSVQTTEMYTHVVNEDLRRIYQDKHSV